MAQRKVRRNPRKSRKSQKANPAYNAGYSAGYTDGKTEEYTKLYTEQVLSWIDPMRVYQELDGCVLLCWEKSGSFCHRRLVAEWLEKGTGKKVDEL